MRILVTIGVEKRRNIGIGNWFEIEELPLSPMKITTPIDGNFFAEK